MAQKIREILDFFLLETIQGFFLLGSTYLRRDSLVQIERNRSLVIGLESCHHALVEIDRRREKISNDSLCLKDVTVYYHYLSIYLSFCLSTFLSLCHFVSLSVSEQKKLTAVSNGHFTGLFWKFLVYRTVTVSELDLQEDG